MKLRLLPAVLLAALLAVALTCAAIAQTSTGTVQGTALDPAGGAVAGVRVTATQTQSGANRTAETGEDGQFRFPALPVGEYTLRLAKAGFATASVQPFSVSLGQTVVHRVTLSIAAVTETVEVKQEPEALETAASVGSVGLGSERLEESPANNRNYLNFVLIAPGVAPSAGSNAQRTSTALRSPLPDSGFSFGGLRGRNNSISIDGVDNRDETSGGSRVSIGLEEVAEFRVAGASVSAELGGAAGGIVNVVTRSGTNLWHGDGTLFAQNEFANARSPEALTRHQPEFRRWQPGTSLNGPLRRDRSFFAAAVEQEWERSQEYSEVPEGLAPLVNAALRSPAFARAGVREATEGLFPAHSSQTQFAGKWNQMVKSRHSLSARYAFSRGGLTGDVLDGDNFADRSARGRSLTVDHSFVAGWVDAVSPNVVNDLRAQVAQRRVELVPNSRGAMLEVPGVFTLGQSYRLDQARTEDHFEASDMLTLQRGPHQIGLGGSVHRIALQARLANRFGGLFVFPTLDAFLAGQPDVFSQTFGDPRSEIRTTPVALWVQDRWQAATGLTLDFGFRFEAQSLPARIPSNSGVVAPRAGFAWRPGGTARFVLRAGAGLFHDRFPLAWLNDALQKDGVHGFEQYAAGGNAAAAFAMAQGGTLPGPLAGVPQSRYLASAHFPVTYSRKVVAGAEYSVSSSTTASLDASWIEGYHLPRTRNAALGLPPQYLLEQTARSSYEGISASVNRRLSKEVAYLFAYSLGRARDDASDFDEQPLHPANTRLDWARSRQHQLQRFTASGLFELPAEELQSAPGWLKDSLESIVVAPIVTYGSGRPLNALETTDQYRTGAYPISARPRGMARNRFFTPALFSLDLRVMKSFPVRHGRAFLQTGVESFNLTNHSNPLRVSPYYAAGSTLLPTYRKVVESLNARQVQFLIQFEY